MIHLAMIVRDEAPVIRRCLMSVRPILSGWTVCDTGSTDGTQDVVRELLDGIPGSVLERPWRDFAHNRTDLVQLAARQADGDPLLVLDADMTATGPAPTLTTDAGMVRLEDGDLTYRLPLLLRPGVPWKYVGAVHEYLDAKTPFTRANVDGLVVTHHSDGSNRKEKFERDLEVLKDAYRKSDSADPRTTFYLAQTYECLGQTDHAIDHYAERRRMAHGWEEERWMALYREGCLLLRTDPDVAVATLLRAHQDRPTRAEPLWALARHFRQEEQDHTALLFAEHASRITQPDDLLFVDTTVYRWGATLELSIACARTGDLRRAELLHRVLLSRPDLPANVRACVEGNQRWVGQQAA